MKPLLIALIFGMNGIALAAEKVDPAMPTDPLAIEKAAVIGTIQENKKPVNLNAKAKKLKKKKKTAKAKAPAAEKPATEQPSAPAQK